MERSVLVESGLDVFVVEVGVHTVHLTEHYLPSPCFIHMPTHSHTVWLYCWFNRQSVMCGSLPFDGPSLSSSQIYNCGRQEVSKDRDSMPFHDWMMDDLKSHRWRMYFRTSVLKVFSCMVMFIDLIKYYQTCDVVSHCSCCKIPRTSYF